MNLIKFLDLKEWNANHSSVWREIVSRFGQSDYDDETLREKHKATLKAEWDAQQYARTRRPLYPDIGDQLDDLYKKGAFSDEMSAKLKKVKDDNPKPS
jgi:hypothetical protein